MHLSPTKFLIPLSYATILGGSMTLIGSSTNLVLYGMAVDAGLPSFGMFEIGKLGLPLAIIGLAYIVFSSKYLLPEERLRNLDDLETEEEKRLHRIEVVLGPRFPAINRKIFDFDFKQKYGATILEVHRGGTTILMKDMRKERFRGGDTLVLLSDDSFMKNWGDSSFFLVVSNGHERNTAMPVWKRYVALALMFFMIGGAFVFGLPGMEHTIPGIKLDMFFFVCITTIIMAWLKIFPARKYTKYISWDILVTIACAFAISKAMQNSGLADAIAKFAINACNAQNPYILLIATFIVTNFFTELVTNNAAVALGFPISLSLAGQLGVNPMAFVFTTLIAASSSFTTPIGYQTNMIVQGFGNYKFSDFTKFGFPLNFISLIVTVALAPLLWPL